MTDIVDIGTDIVEIARMEESVKQDRFLENCFTEGEIEYCGDSLQSFAGLFAAKESIAKAMGTGFSGFLPKDIEIWHDGAGRPWVRLSENVRFSPHYKIKVSISHEKNYATAMAIITR